MKIDTPHICYKFRKPFRSVLGFLGNPFSWNTILGSEHAYGGFHSHGGTPQSSIFNRIFRRISPKKNHPASLGAPMTMEHPTQMDDFGVPPFLWKTPRKTSFRGLESPPCQNQQLPGIPALWSMFGMFAAHLRNVHAENTKLWNMNGNQQVKYEVMKNMIHNSTYPWKHRIEQCWTFEKVRISSRRNNGFFYIHKHKRTRITLE